MAVIHKITLRRDFGKVPKGTAVRIVTSSEADHSMSMVYRALRKEGFADADFRGIGTSAYWDWEVVPGDATALHNELERYSMPVASKKPMPELRILRIRKSPLNPLPAKNRL